jgi:hypothetical protein
MIDNKYKRFLFNDHLLSKTTNTNLRLEKEQKPFLLAIFSLQLMYKSVRNAYFSNLELL